MVLGGRGGGLGGGGGNELSRGLGGKASGVYVGSDYVYVAFHWWIPSTHGWWISMSGATSIGYELGMVVRITCERKRG